jgi:hypothetical protein
MRLLRPVSRLVLYLAAAILVAGCGLGSVIQEVRQQASDAATWERDRDQLRALGSTWHVFHDQNRRSPADWSELLAHDPTLAELKDRGCVITWWGLQLRDAVDGASNTILAYFPDVEKEGGAVLLLDGSVHRMTAEQFNNPNVFFGIRRQPPPPKQAAVQPRPSAATPSAATAPPAAPTWPTPFEDTTRRGEHDRAQTPPSTPVAPPVASPPPTTPTWPSPLEDTILSEENDRMQAPPPAEFPMQPPSVSDRLPRGPRPGLPSRGGPVPGNPTELVGGSGGTVFHSTSPDSRPVLGVRVFMGSWSRQPALQLFEPLFDRRTAPGPGQSIIARDGYAVGALRIHASARVDAVQVVFMRQQQDGRLDPGDAYDSPWVGTPGHGEAITVSGQGIPVIGVHGRRAAVIDALGLVLSSP